MRFFIIFVLLIFCISCKNKAKALSAQEVVDYAIIQSGVDKLNNSILEFDFRNIHYKAKRNRGVFELIRVLNQDSLLINDILSNNGFIREINNKEVVLPDSMKIKYSESVNSVHYFSKLPLGLNDIAVIKETLPAIKIKGKKFYKIKITFQQENGGTDFDDEFIYWFEKNTFRLKYIAYTFHVNGGGMRFREVTKEQIIKGVKFLNYNNYKPNKVSIKLEDIDKEFNSNRLEKLSEINMENIYLLFN